jgi:hypothetical protein
MRSSRVVRPSEWEITAALRDQQIRESFWRVERGAEVDPSLQTRRVLSWLAKRYRVELGEIVVKRYADELAPGCHGFYSRGVIYLSKSAGNRTLLHEGLHHLRPSMSEPVRVRLASRLAGQIERLRTEPVGPTVVTPEEPEKIEWVF